MVKTNALTSALSMCLLVVGSLSAQTTVELRASDGATLRGSYFAGRSGAPAILLVHQCNMDRVAWRPIAQQMAGLGFHVLTPDLRGFGENRLPGVTRVPSEKWGRDLDEWYDWLRTLTSVSRTAIAAGGASCGVVETTLLATRRPIRALIAISGGTNLDGLRYVEGTPGTPVFGAAAEGDDAQGVRDLVAASRHPASTVVVFPGSEHGTPLFLKHPELQATLLRWTASVLDTFAAR